MKKILLATTMLAGTAGFASAEVKLEGWAEIGIWSYNYNNGGVNDTAIAFWQDVEVKFRMSGTTDGGLEFGAVIDLDETNVPVNDDNGTEVWVSGSFGKLTMGDTDGALDWALADMDGGMTSMADDHSTHLAWFGGNDMDGHGDGQIVRYENTFGAVSFAISAEQIGDGVAGGDEVFGIGVKYNADLGGTTLNLGLGYQADSTDSGLGVSVGAEFAGGFSGKLGYISFDYDVVPVATDWDSHTGLELTYKSGPLGVSLNYGKVDLVGGGDFDSWGAVANYDLGGGAVAMFGYGSDVLGLAGNQDQWSLGLGLAF